MKRVSLAEFLAQTPEGTGIHWRVCSPRVALVAPIVERCIVKQCSVCRCDVWYDPMSSVYPPGEVISCVPCFLKLHAQEPSPPP